MERKQSVLQKDRKLVSYFFDSSSRIETTRGSCHDIDLVTKRHLYVAVVKSVWSKGKIMDKYPITQFENAEYFFILELRVVASQFNAAPTMAKLFTRLYCIDPGQSSVACDSFIRLESEIGKAFLSEGSGVCCNTSLPHSLLEIKPAKPFMMSTPMRHGLSQQGRTPSQLAGAAPTPPVSTPFSNSQTQAAFSPPQGSRTSPQQVKKSPATSATLKGMPDSSTAVNFDSPSGTAALGALGIHGMDLNLDAISMGALGLGRADEDDRKKRMDALVHMLKAAGKGRVSNEGLERLARSIGLESLWEDNPAGGPLSKTLVLAGTGLALEIVITNHVVQNVSLTLPESTISIQHHTGKAADMLLRGLKLGPNQSPLTKTLEQFQPNLERLATLDKLSVLPALNCCDAVAGIYESLLKLHNWDMQKLREDPAMRGKTDEALKIAALCTQHGYPQMHARDRIGLSFDYWKERRRIPSTTVDKEDIKTWSMLVDCAPKEDLVYFPIRVSDSWISDAVEKTNLNNDEILAANGPVLDWQEPGSTFLHSDEAKVDTSMQADPSLTPGPKLPDVIFMATFDPPVTVTFPVAQQIYSLSGAPAPEHPAMATFDALIFPITPGSIYDPSEPRSITRLQPVSTFPGKTEKDIRVHKNTLFIYKGVYGQMLTKVPFHHPRQLVEMLPSLRQYAFLSTLLAKSFKPKPGFVEIADEKPKANSETTAIDDFKSFASQSTGESGEVHRGANGTTTQPPSPPALEVDITLAAHPVPRLQVVFPFRSRTANIMLEIHLGGKVHIVSDNVFDSGGSDEQVGGMDSAGGSKVKGKWYSPAQWASMLELTEDLGVWCEYIKHKLE
ncbi:mediator of RNA polymerase II transcription subunit 1-domain-containing protein [Pseudomassariella vexata]|uniref:Mediator of RNA polymerase II transcription subunit 1 n=1 Tax=Pseudomassariella vexata TaxID=1141098 RepID=A0A1Y2DL94_9PEZI|nr:mediator of RNA polymerase II transcription subunit 1-domain-containing protein [Pseudomassariella vexata]ORY59495.1 mediator of RNA polymerase II transcription subunit 1-domain-containing protein [Pseudomassariella vexata]